MGNRLGKRFLRQGGGRGAPSRTMTRASVRRPAGRVQRFSSGLALRDGHLRRASGQRAGKARALAASGQAAQQGRRHYRRNGAHAVHAQRQRRPAGPVPAARPSTDHGCAQTALMASMATVSIGSWRLVPANTPPPAVPRR